MINSNEVADLILFIIKIALWSLGYHSALSLATYRHTDYISLLFIYVPTMIRLFEFFRATQTPWVCLLKIRLLDKKRACIHQLFFHCLRMTYKSKPCFEKHIFMFARSIWIGYKCTNNFSYRSCFESWYFGSLWGPFSSILHIQNVYSEF